MEDYLYGAIATACAVAGLLFLRFYRRTHDRFFLYFVASFWLEAVTRTCAAFLDLSDSGDSPIFVLRIVAYGLILAAIFDKNLPRRHP
jgi:hypothetical protein